MTDDDLTKENGGLALIEELQRYLAGVDDALAALGHVVAERDAAQRAVTELERRQTRLRDEWLAIKAERDELRIRLQHCCS